MQLQQTQQSHFYKKNPLNVLILFVNVSLFSISSSDMFISISSVCMSLINRFFLFLLSNYEIICLVILLSSNLIICPKQLTGHHIASESFGVFQYSSLLLINEQLSRSFIFGHLFCSVLYKKFFYNFSNFSPFPFFREVMIPYKVLEVL